MNLVFWANAGLAKATVIAKLTEAPGVHLTVVESLDAAIAALPENDGLVLYDAPVAQAKTLVAALQAPSSRVRWMHVLTAGREGLEAAGIPQNLAFTTVGAAVAPAVAEHALALLLALGRRLPEAVGVDARATWDRTAAAKTSSLEGATLAIVGYGAIGHEIAQRARAFGAKIVAVSRSRPQDDLIESAHTLDELHDVLGKADAIAIAVAMTPETRHLFNAAAFAACKKGALLVNVARGGVIDQAALIDAVTSGQIGGAGLDVTDPEPLPDGDPLWHAPGILITPHWAGAGSPRSVGRIVASVTDHLHLFSNGKLSHSAKD